jgi:hypothetical protein
MKQTPSDRDFVVLVNPEEREAVTRQLGSLGSIRPLEGTESLLLSVPESRGPAQEVWREAMETAKVSGTIQPVLLDEDGEPHYPTGEITVRFRETFDDERLQRFAVENGLRLLRRNKYVPQQAVFQPVDASRTYLPDLIRTIGQIGDAKTVWANTLSHYTRVG